MSTARMMVGDVWARLAEIPDGSVDLLLSSPPYLAQRSYLPADHPDKALEIGTEPDPATFIDVMLELTAEWRRVLAPHGSICIELGDTYSGSGGAGGDYLPGGWRDSQERFGGSGRPRGSGSGGAFDTFKGGGPGGRGWTLAKSRTLVPESYRWALAYGRSPFTGLDVAGQWLVRQVHYHCRPNPPVGSLGDKFRPSVSEWVIACTSPRRWFDLDAVRTEPITGDRVMTQNPRQRDDRDQRNSMYASSGGLGYNHPAGAPPLNHSWLDWDDWFPAAQRTATTPFKGSHYATFGPAVIRPFIEAMCPREVCTLCGEPRRRLTGVATYVRTDSDQVPARLAMTNGDRLAEGVNQHHQTNGANTSVTRQTDTLGWSHCGCGAGCRPTTWKVDTVDVLQVRVDGQWIDADGSEEGATRTKSKRKRVVDYLGDCADWSHWRRGVVLDPFGGTGTTAEVATGCGRDAILIDLDARNVAMAEQRLGMFLEVVA